MGDLPKANSKGSKVDINENGRFIFNGNWDSDALERESHKRAKLDVHNVPVTYGVLGHTPDASLTNLPSNEISTAHHLEILISQIEDAINTGNLTLPHWAEEGDSVRRVWYHVDPKCACDPAYLPMILDRNSHDGIDQAKADNEQLSDEDKVPVLGGEDAIDFVAKIHKDLSSSPSANLSASGGSSPATSESKSAAADNGKATGTLEEYLKACEKCPELRIRHHDMKTHVDDKNGRATVYVTQDLMGVPPGVVRPSVGIFEWRRREGKWMLTKYRGVRGMGGG